MSMNKSLYSSSELIYDIIVPLLHAEFILFYFFDTFPGVNRPGYLFLQQFAVRGMTTFPGTCTQHFHMCYHIKLVTVSIYCTVRILMKKL